MSHLADKIAAEISPLNPVVLETKNISDLSPAEAANVQAALEAELKNRSFRLLPADSAATAAQSPRNCNSPFRKVPKATPWLQRSRMTLISKVGPKLPSSPPHKQSPAWTNNRTVRYRSTSA